MSRDSMLMCLIAFVLGFLFADMIRGNGLSVGCQRKVDPKQFDVKQFLGHLSDYNQPTPEPPTPEPLV